MEALAVIFVIAAVGALAVSRMTRSRSGHRKQEDLARFMQEQADARTTTLHELARQAEDSGVAGEVTDAGWRPIGTTTPAAARRPAPLLRAPGPTLEGTRGTDTADVLLQLGQAFSPAAPVNRQDLFAGRHSQMETLVNVAFERGQHAAIYGERGVGKTSLATVMTLVFGARGTKLAAKVNCDATDTYDSIWRKAIEEIQIVQQLTANVYPPEVGDALVGAVASLDQIDEVKPSDVRRLLSLITKTTEVVVFVDEFERLRDRRVTTSFADTLKMLSDQQVAATIVIVGVADNIEELIAEHRSVERALVQIHMPRMSMEELKDIVRRGLETVDMKIEDRGADEIALLSRGLPHFTHSIAQASARVALEDSEREITSDHVAEAMRRLVERTHESLVDLYLQAVASKRETIYPQVILAAALARSDARGFFAPADLVEPMEIATGRRYQIPSFSRHLHALSQEARGPALLRRGTEHRYRFRFMNPLLQPFVLMRGIATGMVTFEALDRFLEKTEAAS